MLKQMCWGQFFFDKHRSKFEHLSRKICPMWGFASYFFGEKTWYAVRKERNYWGPLLAPTPRRHGRDTFQNETFGSKKTGCLSFETKQNYFWFVENLGENRRGSPLSLMASPRGSKKNSEASRLQLTVKRENLFPRNFLNWRKNFTHKCPKIENDENET